MKNNQYIYKFSKNFVDGNKKLINILGGKGANLAEMCSLNMPVPPGFTISSEVCNYFLKNNSFPKKFEKDLLSSIKIIEKDLGSRFGDSKNPLLFSIRSGARQSMPGMMETVLNVGLTNKTIIGLINQTSDERFAYDSYRRLIMMYSDVVMEKANNLNVGIREHLDLILMKINTNKVHSIIKHKNKIYLLFQEDKEGNQEIICNDKILISNKNYEIKICIPIGDKINIHNNINKNIIKK